MAKTATKECPDVSGNNLTRDEARHRARDLDISHYDVAIDLTRGAMTFGSTTTVSFTATAAASFIEFTAASVKAIVLNGQELDPAVAFDGDPISIEGHGRV